MLQLIYIIAFTILATLAVANMIRNLTMLGRDSQRPSYSAARASEPNQQRVSTPPASPSVPHPELLDDAGKVVKEPFLVMRSISVEDARERLDALYNSSPGSTELQDDA